MKYSNLIKKGEFFTPHQIADDNEIETKEKEEVDDEEMMFLLTEALLQTQNLRGDDSRKRKAVKNIVQAMNSLDHQAEIEVTETYIDIIGM